MSKNYNNFYRNPRKEEPVDEKPVEKVQPIQTEESKEEPVREEVKEAPKPKPKFAIVVNSKRVNMRMDASKEAPVKMILDQGMKVEILDTNSDKTWSKIRFKNTNGFMMSKFLKAVN